jgi:hypothetical protein
VVAHETGHYLTDRQRANLPDWRRWLAQNPVKHVSGYRPTIEEALAETLRLFILNPDLLRRAVPWRYEFCITTMGLKPSVRKGWRAVLNNANYEPAAERWIGAKG